MPTDNGEATYCNARTRSGPDDLEKVEPGPHAGEGYCSNRTSGGRCWMHGENAGRPSKHGLHSFKREELQRTYERALEGEPWGDLRAEIAALRTLLSDFLSGVERVDADAIDGATKLISELRRTSDTLQEMLHREAPTPEEIERLITSFADILNRYVPDDEARADALDELRSAAIEHRGPDRIEGGHTGA